MTRCPSLCATIAVVGMLRAYAHFRAGFLPEAGGMNDQSATFAEAVGFLEAIRNDHEQIEMDRVKRG